MKTAWLGVVLMLALAVPALAADWPAPTAVTAGSDATLVPRGLVWGPGESPELAFALTDGDGKSKVARVGAGVTAARVLRGRRAPGLQSLGFGEAAIDESPTWWSDFELALVRTESGESKVAVDDGVVRALAGAYGQAREVVRWGAFLVVRSEDSAGSDLHLVDPRRPDAGRRLTETRSAAERSLGPRAGGLLYIEVNGDKTALCTLTMAGQQPCTAYPQLELLALATGDLPGGTIAYARHLLPDTPPKNVLVQLSAAGKWTLLSDDVFLPAGYTPQPAVDVDGGAVLFVNAAQAVVKLTVAGGAQELQALPTAGHREVSAVRVSRGLLLATVAQGEAGPQVFVYR